MLSLVLFAAGAGAIAAMPVAGLLPSRMGGTGMTLRISGPILKLTAAGLKAIAFDEGPKDAIEPGEASQPQLLPEAKNGVSLDDVGRHAPTAAPRDGSKLALMIDLLRRADGATIVDLTQATGWLAHTARAAITGLRKRGYAVTRERIGAGASVYRISGAPAGSGDRVVQTEAVDGRRDPKRRTKRAA